MVAYVLKKHAAAIFRVDKDRQRFSPKRSYRHTKLHDDTTHKTDILKSLKIYPVVMENK
jgi:hypothetical protein